MTDSDLEAHLRRMLAERAAEAAASEPPYAAIVRQGRKARRRFRIGLAAAAVIVAAVPGMTFATQGSWFREEGPDRAAGGPDRHQVASPDADVPEPTGSAGSTGPAGPADPERQLLDGVTLADATDILRRCLEGNRRFPAGQEGATHDLTPEDLHVLLAWVPPHDDGPGEPDRNVLAVSGPGADDIWLVCSDQPDAAFPAIRYGFGVDVEHAVEPELNAENYYQPVGGGQWRTPFRWVDFGLARPEVSRVTVTYAGSTEVAVLDEGHFLATGVAERQPEDPPVVIGYGRNGEVLYDSRQAE